ncbi:MAG TPA: hypothetical protein VIR98_01645 [Candidatus Paceibacterota bacterium]|jgi:hypothetical protein
MDAVNFLNLEYIFLRIFDFFKNLDVVAILNAVIHFIEAIRPFAIIIGLFLAYVIAYSIIRLKQVEKEAESKFHSVRMKDAENEAGADPVLNQKWQKVQEHINSANPSDWRLAIIEADIMLGDILEKMGYQGDSIGDKLKGVEKSDFLTLDLAWEAHKVRNQIAHEGGDFQLNERDARKTIDMYKKVFEEFYYI